MELKIGLVEIMGTVTATWSILSFPDTGPSVMDRAFSSSDSSRTNKDPSSTSQPLKVLYEIVVRH